MSVGVSNRSWGRAIVAGLRRAGVGRFFLSPGARSAPLAAALGELGDDVTVHYDERGMAFAALGWAMATGRPAVCLSTSGSAVANLLPACVEASHSGLPLIFLTADRPASLRGTGANQTILQPGIFGAFVRWSVDLPCSEDASQDFGLSGVLRAAVGCATGDNPGPVHVNVPFREPLLDGDEARALDVSDALPVPPAVDFVLPGDFDFRGFAEARGAVVIGRLAAWEQGEAVDAVRLGAALGWPVFADALSGARLMPGVIRHADWILRRDGVPEPERVLHFGGSLISKRVALWLASCKGRDCVQVRRFPLRLDPWGQAPMLIQAGVAEFCRAVQEELRPALGSAWRQDWASADGAVARVLAQHLDGMGPITEPQVSRSVAKTGVPVFLGNSMPVRDFDSCVDANAERTVRLFGNRGASGIDGNIAAIAGVAIGVQEPVVAVLGDLAALHDLNSLPLLSGLPVTLVIINNGGGGIFRFLNLPVEECLLETPHSWNFRHAAAQFGIEYHLVASRGELEARLCEGAGGPRVLECPTDRESNYKLHTAIAAACLLLDLRWTK